MKLCSRFRHRGADGGPVTSLTPASDGFFDQSGFRVVLCKELGLGLDRFRETRFERSGYLPVQCLAWTAQQCAIGGVLHERMLKQKRRVWEFAALEDQAGTDEETERATQLWLASLSNGGQ